MLNCYCPHTSQYFPQPLGYEAYGNQAYPSVLGEETTTTTVRNDTNETVEVYWAGVGWHCATSWYGGYPFMCEVEILEPGQSATHSAKGYLRGVGVKTRSQFCGSQDLSKGKKSLTVSKIKNSICFPDVGGWLCTLVDLARKIPVVGSAIAGVLNAVGFYCR